MAEEYKIQAVLSVVDNMSYGFERAGAAVKAFGSSVQSKIGTAGKALTVAGAGVTALGVTSVKSFGQFQQSLNTAAVVAGGTSKDIGGLADVANRMGKELPISAQGAADAMIEMARNGANLKSIKSQFPAIAQAATAAGADLQATAGVVQQSMNIWGDSLKSPQQAAGILVQVANQSNASIEDMQQALANVGPSARDVGYSMADTANAIGLLTNTGMSAAQASMNLNHAITLMRSPTAKSAQVMQQLGISFRDAKGNMKSLPQVATELSGAMKGLSKSQQDAYLKTMFGQDGMRVMSTLMKATSNNTNDASKSWDAAAKAIQKYAGTTATATKNLKSQAADMQKNVGAKIEQLGGNWEALRNTAMQSSNGVTTSLLDGLNGMMTWANESDSGIAKVARGFIGLSPVIGPAMTALGGFATNVKNITGAAGSMIAGVGKVTGKLGAFGAKLFKISKPVQEASKATKALGNSTKDAGESAGTSAGDFVKMGLGVLEVGAGIAVATAGMAALVLSITQLAKQGAAGVIALAAVTVAIGALAAAFAYLGPMLNTAVPGMLAFAAVVASIGVGIGVATAGIGLMISAFTQLITAMATLNVSSSQVQATMALLGSSAVIAMTSFVTAVVQAMPQIATAMMQGLLVLLQTINTFLPQIVQQGITLIVNFVSGIAQGLPQIIQAATELIVNFLEGIAQSLPDIITAAVDVITSFIEGIANNLDDIINAGLDLLAKFIMGIVGAIPNIADTAVQAVLRFVYGVGSALGEIIGSGGKLIQAFVKGIIDGFTKSQNAGKKNAHGVKGGILSIDLVGAGKQLIQGFIKGIHSMVHNVINAAESIGKAAVNSVKKFLHIGSPSKLMRDKVGRWVPAGMAVGMKRGSGVVRDAAQYISKQAMVPLPDVDVGGFTSQLSGLTNSFNPNSLQAQLTSQLQVAMQPANINLNLGGRDYAAFVGDISSAQDQQIALTMKRY